MMEAYMINYRERARKYVVLSKSTDIAIKNANSLAYK